MNEIYPAWKMEARRVIHLLELDPADVLEDGFIHPDKNGGIVEFEEIIRDRDNNRIHYGPDRTIASRKRRFDMNTKEEVS